MGLGHHARTLLPWKEGRSAPHAFFPPLLLIASRLSTIQCAIFREKCPLLRRTAESLQGPFKFNQVNPAHPV